MQDNIFVCVPSLRARDISPRREGTYNEGQTSDSGLSQQKEILEKAETGVPPMTAQQPEQKQYCEHWVVCKHAHTLLYCPVDATGKHHKECEYDTRTRPHTAPAQQRIDAAELLDWVECNTEVYGKDKDIRVIDPERLKKKIALLQAGDP
jgi:hypothetical protein